MVGQFSMLIDIITVSQLLDEFLASANTQLDKVSVLYGQLRRDVAHAHLQIIHEFSDD